MFIRYSLTGSRTEIANRFSVDIPEAYQPKYNAAPTHLLPVITQDSQEGVSFFYWGAPPSWANKKPLGEKIINSRLDLVAEKSVLLKKLREKRCLIPADGFYEWKRAGKKTSIPYRFTLKDKDMFAIAGLWEEYDDEKGEMHHTFTVITTEANSFVTPVTDRMPVIVSPEIGKMWLQSANEDELLSILKTPTPPLDFYSVSPSVNFPERNDRLIIMPAPASDQFGNLTLFD
ncbi:MAG: SOS response-associated peptidase [Cyclobacteriaceae bacterium]|nr:SOS response-associated peptidase [Cyclobacteriaceae bacterium]